MKIKRTLAVLLSVAMIITGFNLNVFAQESSDAGKLKEAAQEKVEVISDDAQADHEDVQATSDDVQVDSEDVQFDSEEIEVPEHEDEDWIAVEAEDEDKIDLSGKPRVSALSYNANGDVSAAIMTNGMIYTFSETTKVPYSGSDEYEGRKMAVITFDERTFDYDQTELSIESSLEFEDKEFSFEAVLFPSPLPKGNKLNKVSIGEGYKVIFNPALGMGRGELGHNALQYDVDEIEFPSTLEWVLGDFVQMEKNPNPISSGNEDAYLSDAHVASYPKWFKKLPMTNGVAYIGSVAAYIPGGSGAPSEVSVKEGTTQILPYAAVSNSSLTKVTIPAGVKSIESFAFADCENLKTFDIDKNSSLVDFGYDVFGYYQAYLDSKNSSCEHKFSAPKLESIFLPGRVFENSFLSAVYDVPSYTKSYRVDRLTRLFYNAATLKSAVIGTYEGAGELTIPCEMFYGCSSLTSFSVPKQVVYLGYGAFHGCTAMKTFTIPTDSMLRRIDQDTFGWRTYTYTDEGLSGFNHDLNAPSEFGAPIESIYLPAAVLNKNLDGNHPGLFAGNTALKSVTIGPKDGTYDTQIDFLMFEGCSNLENLSGTVNYFRPGAFANCAKLTTVDFAGTIQIDSAAFAGTGLKEVTIPESVARIEYDAFGACPSLTKMNLNSELKRQSIPYGSQIFDWFGQSGSMLFSDSDVRIINEPMSYERYRALYPSRTALRELNFGPASIDYIKKFETTATSGLCMYLPALEKVTLPEGIKTIGRQMFFNCFSLKEINFPSSIEVIGKNAFLGDPFVDLDFTKLPLLKRVEEGAFRLHGKYGYNTYRESEYLELPDTKYATGLKEVILPEGVEHIGSGAFFGRTLVKKVSIPSSVSDLCTGSFQFLPSLEGIEVDTPAILNRGYNSVTCNSWNDVFWNQRDDSLKSIVIGKNCTVDGAFGFGEGALYGLSEESITVEPHYTKISRAAFAKNENLKRFHIDENCKVIEQAAFLDNKGLTSIVIPETVDTLEIEAFYGSGLKSIAINGADTVIRKPAVAVYSDSTSKMPMSYIFYGENAAVDTWPADLSKDEYKLYSVKLGSTDYSYLGIPTGKKGYIRTEEEVIAIADALIERYVPIPADTEIMGFAGSRAQDYADIFGNPFVVIDEPVKEITSDDDLTGTITLGTVSSNVSVDLNDGSLENDKIYKVSNGYAVLATPVKTGYTFAGWTDGEGVKVSKLSKNYLKEHQDITLSANWTENSYKVVYNANGGAFKQAPAAESHLYTEEFDVYSYDVLKERTGYWIKEWNTAKDGSGIAIGTQDKPDAPSAAPCDRAIAKAAKLSAKNGATVTLYAQWVKTEYNVYYELNGGLQPVGTNGVSLNPAVHTQLTDIALKNPTRTGYTFGGWYADPEFATAKLTKIPKSSQEITLHAKWTANKYYVSYNANGGSFAVTPAKSAHVYGEGSFDIIDGDDYLKPRKGYTFTGWCTAKTPSDKTASYDAGDVVYDLSAVNGATVVLYAQWQLNTYPISYELNGGVQAKDKNGNDANPAVHSELTAVSLKNPTKTGYSFAGWFYDEDCTGVKVTKIAASANPVTVYAKWTPIKYKVELKTNGGRGTRVTISGNEYDKEYVLPAATFTRNGYAFKGWATSSSGEVILEDGATYINLTSKSGATVSLYAIWEKL